MMAYMIRTIPSKLGIKVESAARTQSTPNQALSSETEIRRANGIIDLGRNDVYQSLLIRLGQQSSLNALVKSWSLSRECGGRSG